MAACRIAGSSLGIIAVEWLIHGRLLGRVFKVDRIGDVPNGLDDVVRSRPNNTLFEIPCKECLEDSAASCDSDDLTSGPE